jgi:hypothetical protein
MQAAEVGSVIGRMGQRRVTILRQGVHCS